MNLIHVKRCNDLILKYFIAKTLIWILWGFITTIFMRYTFLSVVKSSIKLKAVYIIFSLGMYCF